MEGVGNKNNCHYFSCNCYFLTFEFLKVAPRGRPQSAFQHLPTQPHTHSKWEFSNLSGWLVLVTLPFCSKKGSTCQSKEVLRKHL